ncbi:MAG TPA: right-handed parallel beta-helix repeat-containing protein [Acidobacteriaceae bacterium]|nr:right-handed parallel beta-helix repeat-containing protein [Acidobacteriaceae bacterium]
MITRRTFLGALSAIPVFVRNNAYAWGTARAREYHVSPQGSDKNKGTTARPFRTIGAAAARAFPGDVITVHEGVYRERVSPARGGTSDENRIVYRAAPGERVEITGAEVVKGWKRLQDDVWSVTIPNSFFGEFNPYSDVIHGDWFDAVGRTHHTGAVYLNGDWFVEAASVDEVLHTKSKTPLWFGQVNENTTTIWAQFEGVDPNQQLTEINVRQTVFYPEKTGIDFITVRGFMLRRAATPWAPPTAEQKGVIGTHWSKGWIIEDCDVSYSICCGIALGKYGDQWDNTSANSAEGYVKTIERAEQHGWSKENIGHHIVRNNRVSHCEQAGIVGSLGPVFSIVSGNTIHDIHVRQRYSGAEIAGIKFHAAIDVELSHNHIYRTYRGMWLDWMAQGTRVTGNLFHDNQAVDLFVEVDHGPFIVDNNLFLSKNSLHVNSQGGAFAHNLLLGGAQVNQYDARMTPFMLPHSTQVAGYHDNPNGDIRFLNNVLAQGGDLTQFNQTRLPMHLDGNVFVGHAKPCAQEDAPLLQPEFDPDVRLEEKSDGFYLEMTLDSVWAQEKERRFVTTESLGVAVIPNLPFENFDGGPVRIDKDFSGKQRNVQSPFPGPFEAPEGGRQTFKVS